jgi:hypothetical protein
VVPVFDFVPDGIRKVVGEDFVTGFIVIDVPGTVHL